MTTKKLYNEIKKAMNEYGSFECLAVYSAKETENTESTNLDDKYFFYCMGRNYKYDADEGYLDLYTGVEPLMDTKYLESLLCFCKNMEKLFMITEEDDIYPFQNFVIRVVNGIGEDTKYYGVKDVFVDDNEDGPEYRLPVLTLVLSEKIEDPDDIVEAQDEECFGVLDRVIFGCADD